MQKKKAIMMIVAFGAIATFGFQNCSKVAVSDISGDGPSTVAGNGLDGDNDGDGNVDNGMPGTTGSSGNPGVSGNPGTSTNPGTTTNPGTPGGGMPPVTTAPPPKNPPVQPPVNQPPTNPGSGPKDWLAKNCDPAVLRQKPLSPEFEVQGSDIRKQQLNTDVLEISLARSFSGNQISAKKILIEKTGEVSLQQVTAEKVEIETMNLTKLHQIAVDELFVRAGKVSTNIEQIHAASFDESPKFLVQAPSVRSIHQLQALCLRTISAESIHQVANVVVIGEGPNSRIKQIHQAEEVEVQDANVDTIQQVDVVVLKNSHVRKVQQVKNLFLINSTVDEMQQVGQVSED